MRARAPPELAQSTPRPSPTSSSPSSPPRSPPCSSAPRHRSRPRTAPMARPLAHWTTPAPCPPWTGRRAIKWPPAPRHFSTPPQHHPLTPHPSEHHQEGGIAAAVPLLPWFVTEPPEPKVAIDHEFVVLLLLSSPPTPPLHSPWTPHSPHPFSPLYRAQSRRLEPAGVAPWPRTRRGARRRRTSPPQQAGPRQQASPSLRSRSPPSVEP